MRLLEAAVGVAVALEIEQGVLVERVERVVGVDQSFKLWLLKYVFIIVGSTDVGFGV